MWAGRTHKKCGCRRGIPRDAYQWVCRCKHHPSRPKKGAGNHLVSSSDSGPAFRRFPLSHKELLPNGRCCDKKNDLSKRSALPDTGPDARRSRGTVCGLQPPVNHAPSTPTEGEVHPTSLWGSGIPPVLTHRLLPLLTQKIELYWLADYYKPAPGIANPG